MNFDQIVKELMIFFYQFIEPFLSAEKEVVSIHAALVKLRQIRPGKAKAKQATFKKKYIKVWQRILSMLRKARCLRGHVDYVPHIQLLKNINCYIDPNFHQDIFEISTQLSAAFYIQYFQLRNTAVKNNIVSIFGNHTDFASKQLQLSSLV